MTKRLRAALPAPFILGAIALAGALSGCAMNPATGEESFTAFMSPGQEMRIGAEQHPKLLAEFGGAYGDPEVARYMTSVGRLLQSASEMRDPPFTFTVVNSPTVNAFALPGGYVYVTRGLMALANNEAELAGVIAHEIGHVTARHAAQRYSHGVVAGLGATLLGILTESPQVGQLGQLAATAYIQGYSREQEFEADRLGIRYMTRAGYDPTAMASFLASLEAEDVLAQKIAGKEGKKAVPELFRSHPRTAARIVEAAQLARRGSDRPVALDREVYLRKIDGLIYGDAPEQGFVKGRLFAHPVLGFQFEAPPGFRLRNTEEAVIGEHERGAFLVFDADRPATRDVGILWYLVNDWAKARRLEETETIEVNGMPAATGRTRLRTRDGTFDARLVAIRFAPDHIYRFLFLTPPGATSALDVELRRTTYSFRRLSAAEAAQLKPRRIRLVEVRPGDTPENLARSMAVDDFPVETFRVLNGLKAGQPLEPGRLVKIVAE